MIVSAIWAVDLDNSALNLVFLKVAVYRNQCPLVGICTSGDDAILSPKANDCRGALDGLDESYDQTCERFCN